MKYNCVRIDPDSLDDCWRVSFTKDNTDRKRMKTLPNAGGWYHYPANMTQERALKLLLDCMRKRHKDEIKKLEKSLEKLEMVK